MKKSRLLVFCSIFTSFLIGAWVAYSFWTPGLDVNDGRNDIGRNALWLQHGWLGSDGWFDRYHKNKKLFRDDERIAVLAELVKQNHIKFVFPHLCPCSKDGTIAESDDMQIEKVLDKLDGVDILPWVGGVLGTDVRLEDSQWRSKFIGSIGQLLEKHPRLSGIHINIEPLPSGERNYLLLLEELRAKLPEGKLISIAAYPPSTILHPSSIVHWEEPFSRKVASRVDQVAVMMYDTAIKIPKLYESLMKSWTVQVLDWYEPKQVLLGIPAYDDAGVNYHDAKTENITNALLGINAGLTNPLPKNYEGVAIYCEWEMDTKKWRQFQTAFLKR